MTTSSPSHRLIALGIAATAVLSTGACSEPADKKADATSGVGTTLVDPAATTTSQVAAAPTTTSTAPASPTTTRSPATTRPSPLTQNVVLAGDGLGVARFGDAADVALTRLTAKLGAPLSDGPPGQPCNPKITRTVDWAGVSANLGSTFVGYHHSGSSDNPQYKTEAGIGLRSTVAQLKAAYGTKVKLNPGEEGTPFSVTLPSGTIRGTASGPQDTDIVFALYAGTTCDS